MVRHCTMLATVVAQNVSLFVLVLLWHRITDHVIIDLSPAVGHVPERLLANGAAIITLCVFIQALQVHVMSAFENAHWLDRRKHMLSADRTIAMECILEAHVVVENAQVNTAPAFGAVLVIDSQSLPDTAQPTILAVKDGFVGIRKQMACVAVILGHPLATHFVAAILRSWLDSEAMHAHHLFYRIPIDFVVRVCIVAKSARIKVATARRSNLRLPRVM